MIAPVHANTVGLFEPRKLKQAIDLIEEMCEYENVPYSNWFQDVEFADRGNYHDAIHLNTAGATRFTRRLAEGLVQPSDPFGSTASLR